MRIEWFVKMNEKSSQRFAETKGEPPLVGQCVYLNDYTVGRQTGLMEGQHLTRRVFKVERSDIILTITNTKPISEVDTVARQPEDRFHELVEYFEKETGKTFSNFSVDKKSFVMAGHMAQVVLVPIEVTDVK